MFEKLLLAATITFSLNLFTGLNPQSPIHQTSPTSTETKLVPVAQDVSTHPQFPLQQFFH